MTGKLSGEERWGGDAQLYALAGKRLWVAAHTATAGSALG